MGLQINSNIASLIARNNYDKVNRNRSSSIGKIASGLRINKAADDASGLYIADQLQSQARGLGQAIKNANDAISISQTADGALDESIKIVNIIKTKAIQASQDGQTYESRKAIQEDINKLRQELDHIARSTSFNGQKLLSGSFTNKSFQVGAYTGETVNISINSSESTKIGHTAIAKVVPDHTKPISTTLGYKATGEKIVLESFQIEYDNTPENGIGALARQINKFEDKTDVKAFPVVASESNIISGNTGDDFKINGILIGNLEVLANDSDGRLMNAINNQSDKTGVTANVTTSGKLELFSTDGRAIKVEGLPRPEVVNGRALTTHGYLKMISKNFGQYNITQDQTVIIPSSTPLTQIPSTNVLNEIPTNTFMTWSSASSGSGGGIATSITSVINQGSLTATSMSATDSYFISKFSSNYPVLHYDTLAAPPADIFSAFLFSSPLPIGSKLFIVDVDQLQSFTLTSSGTPLTLLDQIPSKTGSTPSFPNYNPATGNLVSGPGGTDREVSVFDLSNLSSVDVHFQGGGIGTDVFFAISLPNSSPNNPAVGFEEIISADSIVTEQKLLRLCDVNVTTLDDAQVAMDIADVSLIDLGKTRSNVGSVQNQLESTISNITNTQFNANSSESSIRDLDFVDESSNLSKLQVLMESGSFALSNANKSKEILMSLLKEL